MRLYPLDPTSRTANNMFKLSRELGIKREVIAEKTDYLKSAVIIANGSPEDYVLVLLAYHENGGNITGVVKPPGKTGLSAIDTIQTLVKTKANKLLFIIDQEDMRVHDLFSSAENKLREKFNIELLYEDTKIREYECKRGMFICKLILVVNGLDDIETEKHTIEDHLVRAARKLGIMQAKEPHGSTKDVWRSLSRDRDTVKLSFRGFEKPLLREVVLIRWLLKALKDSGLLG